MVAKFLDLQNRELKQWRWQRQRERQKSCNRFMLAKQQLCTCITLFCTFLGRRCTTATWNVLILHVSRSLWSRWTQHKTFCFLFIHLDTVLSDSTPEHFANIWQMKWNWMRLMKCETVRIHFFLSDIFGLFSSRNFAAMVMWCNDFLYYGHFRLRLGNSNLFPWSVVRQIDASNRGLHVQYILVE